MMSCIRRNKPVVFENLKEKDSIYYKKYIKKYLKNKQPEQFVGNFLLSYIEIDIKLSIDSEQNLSKGITLDTIREMETENHLKRQLSQRKFNKASISSIDTEQKKYL